MTRGIEGKDLKGAERGARVRKGANHGTRAHEKVGLKSGSRTDIRAVERGCNVANMRRKT